MAKVFQEFRLDVEKIERMMSDDERLALTIGNLGPQLIQELEDLGFIVIFSHKEKCRLPVVINIGSEIQIGSEAQKEDFILQQTGLEVCFWETVKRLQLDQWFSAGEFLYDKEALKLVDELGLSLR